MRLLIAGGTGFLGGPLCQMLARRGHELVVLMHRTQARSRSGMMRCMSWEDASWREGIAQLDGVINLAGASIAAARWTRQRKQILWESRVLTTRALISAIASQQSRPQVFINASAVGYYGASGDEQLSEDAPPGRGFLSELCQAWEQEARAAEALGVRVVRLRIGLVLAPDGGALSKIVPPFRWCMGGPLGSGRQWVSWIHRDDVIGLIEWVLTRTEISGVVNATAPHPVTMRELCRTLAHVLNRPSWAPMPAPMLRLLLGEMADLLVSGQRVIPQLARRTAYSFAYPKLVDALQACLCSLPGCRCLPRDHR